MPDEAPKQKPMSDAPADFLQLCWRYLDGPLDARDVAELNRQLAESPEKRHWFRELAITRASLIEALGDQTHVDAPVDLDDDRRVKRNTDFQVKVFRADVKPGADDKSAKWRVGRRIAVGGIAFAAIAAGVVFIVGVFVLTGLKSKPNTTMRMVASSHAKWIGPVNIGPAGRINTSRAVTLASGLAEVKLTNGVSLVLQGPVALQVRSPLRVRLFSGRLVATVPHTDIGFTVVTTEGEATDLGTQFGIQAARGKPTIVEVFKGYVRVAVESSSGRLLASRVMVAGQVALMQRVEMHRAAHAVLSLIPPTPEKFVLPQQLTSATR